MQKKQLWLLVGGNGVGKSTFYNAWLAPLGLPFVNADLIAKDLFAENPEKNSYSASLIAEEMRSALLKEGRSFCFETVFSHTSKIDFVGRAKALGYEIIMVFIHLENSCLNKARVSQRVECGGHNVPDDKVENRIPRVLENVKAAIPLCDQVQIFDNSSATNPYESIAVIKNGELETATNPLPDWAAYVIDS